MQFSERHFDLAALLGRIVESVHKPLHVEHLLEAHQRQAVFQHALAQIVDDIAAPIGNAFVRW